MRDGPSPDEPAASDDDRISAGKLESELAALRGMSGVFAHDLSNPLQSLTVLLELTLDEEAVGGSSWNRIGQSLEAAKAMHSLVHDFVRLMRPAQHSAVDASFGAVVVRCLGMFRRRFERQNIRVRPDLRELEMLSAPPREFVWAFLNLLLGIVSCCMTPGYSAYELDITAHTVNPSERYLVLELSGRARSADALALVLPSDAMRLVRQALLGTGFRCETTGNTHARIRFDAQERDGCRQ